MTASKYSMRSRPVFCSLLAACAVALMLISATRALSDDSDAARGEADFVWALANPLRTFSVSKPDRVSDSVRDSTIVFAIEYADPALSDAKVVAMGRLAERGGEIVLVSGVSWSTVDLYAKRTFDLNVYSVDMDTSQRALRLLQEVRASKIEGEGSSRRRTADGGTHRSRQSLAMRGHWCESSVSVDLDPLTSSDVRDRASYFTLLRLVNQRSGSESGRRYGDIPVDAIPRWALSALLESLTRRSIEFEHSERRRWAVVCDVVRSRAAANRDVDEEGRAIAALTSLKFDWPEPGDTSAVLRELSRVPMASAYRGLRIALHGVASGAPELHWPFVKSMLEGSDYESALEAARVAGGLQYGELVEAAYWSEVDSDVCVEYIETRFKGLSLDAQARDLLMSIWLSRGTESEAARFGRVDPRCRALELLRRSGRMLEDDVLRVALRNERSAEVAIDLHAAIRAKRDSDTEAMREAVRDALSTRSITARGLDRVLFGVLNDTKVWGGWMSGAGLRALLERSVDDVLVDKSLELELRGRIESHARKCFQDEYGDG